MLELGKEDGKEMYKKHKPMDGTMNLEKNSSTFLSSRQVKCLSPMESFLSS